jgi:hypothetical protein
MEVFELADEAPSSLAVVADHRTTIALAGFDPDQPRDAQGRWAEWPIATVTDPAGRRVRLTERAWPHILRGRPNMADHRDAVLATVEAPDLEDADPHPSGRRRRLYRQGVGADRWLRVVVEDDKHEQTARIVEGTVVTASGEGRQGAPERPDDLAGIADERPVVVVDGQRAARVQQRAGAHELDVARRPCASQPR